MLERPAARQSDLLLLRVPVRCPSWGKCHNLHLNTKPGTKTNLSIIYKYIYIRIYIYIYGPDMAQIWYAYLQIYIYIYLSTAFGAYSYVTHIQWWNWMWSASTRLFRLLNPPPGPWQLTHAMPKHLARCAYIYIMAIVIHTYLHECIPTKIAQICMFLPISSFLPYFSRLTSQLVALSVFPWNPRIFRMRKCHRSSWSGSEW